MSYGKIIDAICAGREAEKAIRKALETAAIEGKPTVVKRLKEADSYLSSASRQVVLALESAVNETDLKGDPR